MDQLLSELVELERGALDRWIRLDPEGYLRLFAPDVTYFDPTTETRVDGRESMRTRLEPMKNLSLPSSSPRYAMIGAAVQPLGDAAVLSFNLVNYGTLPGQGERELARWNATEVYRRVDGSWHIHHSHWSYVKATPAQSSVTQP